MKNPTATFEQLSRPDSSLQQSSSNPYKDTSTGVIKKVSVGVVVGGGSQHQSQVIHGNNSGRLRNPSITEYTQSKKAVAGNVGGSCTAKHVSTSSIDLKSGNLTYYNQHLGNSKYPMPKKLSISISSGGN